MLRIDVGGHALTAAARGTRVRFPTASTHASRVAWSPTDPTKMVIDVRRFEACGLLPATHGEPPPQGQNFLEGQLGISAQPVRRLTITLDDSVRIGLIGFDTDLVKRQGNGADLVPLLVELDRAYNELLAAPLLAGGDADPDHRRTSTASGSGLRAFAT